jgi:NADPH:quinone reductase
MRLTGEAQQQSKERRCPERPMREARKWVAVDFGGPEVLRSVDVEVPGPRPGQVTVEIRAAGMNPADAKHIAPGQNRELLPLDLGYEVAGVVVEVGAGASQLSRGDEVIAALVTGGYATVMTVPAADVFTKPTNLSFPEAANLMMVGTTAADLLHTSAAARGDTVLLHGAAGAVGTSVLQQARVLGVRVVGTASAANFDLVRQFGGIPVEYGPGLLDRVRVAAPNGVDAALDTVGSDEAGDVSLALVADRTRVVTIVAAARAKSDGYVFVGAANPKSGPFRARARSRVVTLAESGELIVPMAQTFAFDDAPAAFTMLTGPHPAGKLALVNRTGADGSN